MCKGPVNARFYGKARPCRALVSSAHTDLSASEYAQVEVSAGRQKTSPHTYRDIVVRSVKMKRQSDTV